MIARASTIVLVAIMLGASSFARCFLVHLVDDTGGVQCIGLRPAPGWDVLVRLPSEQFRPQGYLVLMKGNENGVAGASLLHAHASFGFWAILVVAGVLVAMTTFGERRTQRGAPSDPSSDG